ncbi:hypothetical protein R3P38DRAFT_2769908 [Favolaschia claudopus]|uniref:Uncharacterized protein n=1 Tax=Favolaschia claudopus TaxID=2862362 RepID=A0AAW0CLP3_9AGAR
MSGAERAREGCRARVGWGEPECIATERAMGGRAWGEQSMVGWKASGGRTTEGRVESGRGGTITEGAGRANTNQRGVRCAGEGIERERGGAGVDVGNDGGRWRKRGTGWPSKRTHEGGGVEPRISSAIFGPEFLKLRGGSDERIDGGFVGVGAGKTSGERPKRNASVKRLTVEFAAVAAASKRIKARMTTPASAATLGSGGAAGTKAGWWERRGGDRVTRHTEHVAVTTDVSEKADSSEKPDASGSPTTHPNNVICGTAPKSHQIKD